jgi:hypothetical protein
MEFVELQRVLQDTVVDHVVEAGRLATLVRDVSKVPADLGMPPIPEIPQDPRMAGDILEVVDVILDTCTRPTPLGTALEIRHYSLVVVTPVVRPAPTFSFVFVLLS